MAPAAHRLPAAIAAALATLLALGVAAPAPAHAQRPQLAGEATYGLPGGDLLVHYATAGDDAPPPADADGDGVPDFVESVAEIAEAALDQLVALGFRAPLPDALGGDSRTDIYLRNLVSADGSAGIDGCTANRCVGYVVAENDYAGYSYPSVTEGIQSVVPHEIFHLIQYAYAGGQPSSWTEGSAVWAVEQLYGAGNSDFERFLPSFLTRSFRPFERAPAGFGDGYAYGAALWPYFLAHRFEPAAVVEAWQASESAVFLDAAGAALASRGSSLEAAFIELTRWNLFTGARAAGGGYPDAGAWPVVPLEPAADGDTRIFIEGLSARYLPLTVGELPRVAVRPPAGLRVAAWLVRDGGTLADGVELTERDGVLAATAPPGAYTLVVTGLSRGTIATAVEVELTPPVDDEDGGGCSAAGGGAGRGGALALLVVIYAARPRRRR
ncbi:MAG TPA: MXAN_6640 family putative metalloprotease [Kofleriaceae bacterium]|nr:MXAN_6640 family putative metalloprotease [Kofleriaceae bacterium]